MNKALRDYHKKHETITIPYKPIFDSIYRMFNACLLALDSLENVYKATEREKMIEHCEQAVEEVFKVTEDCVNMPERISAVNSKHTQHQSESEIKSAKEFFGAVESTTIYIAEVAHEISEQIGKIFHQLETEMQDLINTSSAITKSIRPNSESDTSDISPCSREIIA